MIKDKTELQIQWHYCSSSAGFDNRIPWCYSPWKFDLYLYYLVVKSVSDSSGKQLLSIDEPFCSALCMAFEGFISEPHRLVGMGFNCHELGVPGPNPDA
ncbi:hypothetical protein PTKIN_Ptkin02bG0251500 [Pterospermum kingtungense]